MTSSTSKNFLEQNTIALLVGAVVLALVGNVALLIWVYQLSEKSDSTAYIIQSRVNTLFSTLGERKSELDSTVWSSIYAIRDKMELSSVQLQSRRVNDLPLSLLEYRVREIKIALDIKSSSPYGEVRVNCFKGSGQQITCREAPKF